MTIILYILAFDFQCLVLLDLCRLIQILHWLSQLVRVILFPKHALVSQNLKVYKGLNILLSDIEFMDTCSFTMDIRKISACSKVFVEWYYMEKIHVNE